MEKSNNIIDTIALVLVIVGGINWGLIGLLDFNLVASIFGDGSIVTRIIYILVGIAALYTIIPTIKIAQRTGPAKA